MTAGSPFAREVRMPLQLGKSALVEAAVASALTLTVVTAGIAALPARTTLGWVVAIGAIVVGVVLLWVGASSLIGSRASDVVLGPDGLRIDGGPRHALRVRWDELDPATCRIRDGRKDRRLRGHLLEVATRDGRQLELAEVWQPDDLPALEVLLEEIRAVQGAAGAPAPATVDQLRCGACDAVVRPVDAERTRCGHCAAAVTVPAAVRERVRAVAERRARRARDADQIQAILDQPGATRANRVIAACAAAGLTAPVVALLGFRAAPGVGVALAAWGGAIAASLAVTGLGWRPIARRAALRTCLLELGARRSDQPGGAPRCRTCGGALPDDDVQVLACAYCGADNLLGVDARGWRAPEQGRERTFAQVLDARRASLSEARTTAIVLGLIAVATWGYAAARIADAA